MDVGKPNTVPTEWGFRVYRHQNNLVVIEQDAVYLDDEQHVYLHPEKVNKLIEFLIEVRDDCLTHRADEAAAKHDLRRVRGGQHG